jgi:N-acetyl-alpha-D-muramate 1-phosphate uridylyltransferase
VLPVAILAGGRATRLHPISALIPKALMSVAGRPFIFHQLELLRGQGIERVVLCVGHLGAQIQATVGNGHVLGLSIEYSFDGTTLLGTGGALKRAVPLLGEHFFVLYGDSYLPCSFHAVQSAYELAQRAALMTVIRNEDRWDRSNLIFRDGVVLDYDKRRASGEMLHIDFGLSVFSSAVFAPYEEGCSLDLADICHTLSRQGQLAGFEVSQRFYEIGSLQGMRDTDAYLSRQLRTG